MAKFATAVCVLLGALSAHGSILSSFGSSVTGVISSMKEEVENATSTMTNAVSTNVQEQESYITSIQTQITKQITMWNATIEKLKEASDNVMNCSSSSLDFVSTSTAILSDVTNCAKEYMKKIQSKYDSQLESAEKLLTQFASVQSDVDACIALSVTSQMSCFMKLMQTDMTSLATNVTTILTSTTGLVTLLASSQSNMQACASEAGVNSLESQSQTALTEIKSCIGM